MTDYRRYQKYKKKYCDLKNILLGQRGGENGIFPFQDEIHFWGRQVTEHTLMLYLGLEDNNNLLKNEAYGLHVKWKSFMDTNFYSKGIEVNIEQVFLSEDDISKIGKIDKIDTKTLMELINETKKFNDKLINILGGKEQRWIGWIFISLVKHMQAETIYFEKKISDSNYTVEEEIEFINNHHSTEMAATAQFIDPDVTQQKIIDIVRSYALKEMSVLKKGNSLSGIDAIHEKFPLEWTENDEKILKGLEKTDLITMLRISIKYSKELTDFANDTNKKLKNNQPKSIISPVLAYHVYREFDRFTKTLEKLKELNNSSYINH